MDGAKKRNRVPGPARIGSPAAARFPRAAALPPVAVLLLVAVVGGCAAFGLPDFPPQWRAPAAVEGALFVVYDPQAVLGFGHTALIVRAAAGGPYYRYEQYASSEIAYHRHTRAGGAGMFEWFTARAAAIFGATREFVTRREASAPALLVATFEVLVPVPEAGMDLAAIRRAAEGRYRAARKLEQETAPAYFLLSNSCQHFLRATLGAGGPMPDDFFPKNFAQSYLDLYQARAP